MAGIHRRRPAADAMAPADGSPARGLSADLLSSSVDDEDSASVETSPLASRMRPASSAVAIVAAERFAPTESPPTTRTPSST